MDTPVEHDQNRLYALAQSYLGRLQIPSCSLLLRHSDKLKARLDVYDELRRKWVALTPEEWVRQHFVALMVNSLGYPRLRLANEVTLKLNGMMRRADTVFYDDTLQPALIVEYKAPAIALSNEVLQQALRYNLVFNARGLVICNGIDVYSVVNGNLTHGLITCSDLMKGTPAQI